MTLNLSESQKILPKIPSRDLLRLASAGSVDDGKSTLIGRLLYDTDSLPLDHIESVRQPNGELDFAALSDGLRSEREQGITIDVAYRYFSSQNRNYILADTPGHELYTRNMFTGASTADAAILLIDAEKGVLQQTRRHAKIANLLGVTYIIAAVNKMDRIHYNQLRYQAILQEVQLLSHQLNQSITAIPLAAKLGDNIVQRSSYMPWYTGPTLFEFLENLEIEPTHTAESYLPIQGMIRADSSQKRRYIGRIESGSFQIGDEIIVFPSTSNSIITALDNLSDSSGKGSTGQSVAIELADELDVGRGSVIALQAKHQDIQQSSRFDAIICWFHTESTQVGKSYSIKLATQNMRGEISALKSRINLEDFTNQSQITTLSMNDIGEITVQIYGTLLATKYKDNNVLGSFIIIDDQSQNTAGAGFITHITPTISQQNSTEIWISGNSTGPSGAIILTENAALIPKIQTLLSERGLISYQLSTEIIAHDIQSLHILPSDRINYHKVLALRLAEAGIYPIVNNPNIHDALMNRVGINIPLVSVNSLQHLYKFLDSH